MRATWPEDVGRIARERRQELDISQQELAERAGVTRQWLSRFEQAKADVSLSKAMGVLRELGLIIDVRDRAATGAINFSMPAIKVPSITVPQMPKFKTPILDPAVLAPLRETMKRAAETRADWQASLNLKMRDEEPDPEQQEE